MCELMALAFNEAVLPRFSFRGFIPRGAINPDGWGIAHYPDDQLAAQIIKEPLPANRSTLAAFLRDHQAPFPDLYRSCEVGNIICSLKLYQCCGKG